MRIFVTGASGFVGRAFCAKALARGDSLLCLTRPGGDDVHAGAAGLAQVHGDLATPPWREIERFAPDTLLHLAWITTPGHYLDSPLNEHLLEQSATLLDGLAARGVSHLAVAGTCVEYASSPEPLSESTSQIAPDSRYSLAKHQLHAWMQEQTWAGDVGWSWMRIFYPYGPGEHPSRLASQFATHLAARKEVVLQTPSSTKDFVFISDLAHAISDVLAARLAGVVNLGTGQGTSIRRLAESVARSIGAPEHLIRDADELAIDPRPSVVADVARLAALGWKPRVDLATGIDQLVGSLGLATR